MENQIMIWLIIVSLISMYTRLTYRIMILETLWFAAILNDC